MGDNDKTMTSSPSTCFAARVHQAVASLPPGTCASYGEIAAEVGRPGAARAVGNVLSRSGRLPWWRIVRADGSLPKGTDQERRLIAEGVTIINGRVPLAGR